MYRHLVLTSFLLFFALPSNAQSSKIESLNFMTGSWITTNSSGMQYEQVFLPPDGGTVTGIQRRIRNDSTLVTFFFVIAEENNSIVCRFKHFENNYETYEERLGTGPRTFKLVGLEGSSATFEEKIEGGSLFLRYRKTKDGQLGVAVATSLDEFKSGSATETLYKNRER